MNLYELIILNIACVTSGKGCFYPKDFEQVQKLCLGMGMCQYLDVFSHTQAQEK